MKNYVKPMILANEELAEGVYAASGASTGSAGITGSAKEAYTWTNGGQYTVTVKNNTAEKAETWEVTLNVTAGTVTNAYCYDTTNYKVELRNGNQIVVASNSAWVSIDAGKSRDVTIIVEYSSDSITIA